MREGYSRKDRVNARLRGEFDLGVGKRVVLAALLGPPPLPTATTLQLLEKLAYHAAKRQGADDRTALGSDIFGCKVWISQVSYFSGE